MLGGRVLELDTMGKGDSTSTRELRQSITASSYICWACTLQPTSRRRHTFCPRTLFIGDSLCLALITSDITSLLLALSNFLRITQAFRVPRTSAYTAYYCPPERHPSRPAVGSRAQPAPPARRPQSFGSHVHNSGTFTLRARDSGTMARFRCRLI
ncbi:hypothetical protein BOTBODRAFT_541173 [Botryobasidium botryosum FD-172 SS1]|uniref:Uncharacterized protein n=1 Tax=Botryobasidium botryosum (strain FD-172 SS1) TaxID=930990 RepID=A0A067MBM4_BOTB1|nr:hypothetical protein BOTBODRAFT_541173 [Botryobasidium botryosum FD-172 SS1]